MDISDYQDLCAAFVISKPPSYYNNLFYYYNMVKSDIFSNNVDSDDILDSSGDNKVTD